MRMKLLYVHNSLPEYRYGYFQAINDSCDLTIAFTDINLSQEIYKTSVDDNRLANFDHVVILQNNLREDKKILNSLIKTQNFDFIIIPALDDLYSIFLSLFILKMARKYQIKTGLFWEKWECDIKKQSIKRRIKERLQSLLIRKPMKMLDIFWSPGRKTTEYLLKHNVTEKQIYKIHDTSICPTTINIDIYEKYHISHGNKIILYFGRLVDYKGADNLIKAFAQTNEGFRKSHTLVIAGSGESEEKFKNITKQLNVDNVVFTGFAKPENRAAFFKACDVFVLPVKIVNGKVEAWGLTVNEAIQFGKIVIATDAVASAHELINERNGFVVRENNINDLKVSLEKSDSLTLKTSAKKEDERIMKIYTYSQMAKDIIDVIEKNQ